MIIPFNRPHLTGKEITYITDAHALGKLAGDGPFTKRCHTWMESCHAQSKALLTHSCTAALEMSALLLNIQPGDEVIMPSYTFVSTANAFVLRGATPVFVDIRSDTLNINEDLIEPAITSRTRAVIPVHYAGVPCEMDSILRTAKAHNLIVIEDAAQGLMSTYREKLLGTFGAMAAFSFHETKNIISGEGGALLVNDQQYLTRAQIIREKGTNRSQFFLGQVDKYTWCDTGSSFLPGELTAAFLYAQMENAASITRRRIDIWNAYHSAFQQIEADGLIRRPIIPSGCAHNAHMYYLLLPDPIKRAAFIHALAQKSISTVFHYIPLHQSPYGSANARICGTLTVTDKLSSCLVRLPLWIGIEEFQEAIISEIINTIHSICR